MIDSTNHAPRRGAVDEIFRCNTASRRLMGIREFPCAVAHGYKRYKRYAPFGK